MRPRRVVVFGPVVQALVILSLLATAVVFLLAHEIQTAVSLVAAALLLPVERGYHHGDGVRVVTRGTGGAGLPPSGPPPLPPPDESKP
jgi:hypothetical protein